MLTRKQHELLLFIDQYLKRKGFSPSFEEMKDALQLRSKSGIHRLISALEERGFLARRRHRARALEVTRLPDQPLSAAMPDDDDDDIVKSNDNDRPTLQQDVMELPLYGKIAAGAPIEALQDGGDRVCVPLSMLGSGTHYALHIAGDSMIEAGILDGDMALIREGARAEEGDIVVALIDETEATLKRLHRRNHMVALEPANAQYETRLLPAERVRVQGKLVGLMRRY